MVIRRQCNIINEKTKNNQSKYKIINKNSKRRERQRKQHHIVTCFFVSTYSSSLCCSVCKTPRCRERTTIGNANAAASLLAVRGLDGLERVSVVSVRTALANTSNRIGSMLYTMEYVSRRE